MKTSLRRLTGPAAFFALAVLWSNIWGQAREVLSSSLFSNGAVAAYNLATQVPFNTPQIVTLALTAAMVPVLVELRRHGREDEARRIAGGVVTTVGAALAVISISGMLFPRPILELFFYWKPSSGDLDLAVDLSRILFPYVFISGVSGAISAILQAFERFRPLAAGQLAPNMVIVACILMLRRGQFGIRSQAIGLVLGAAAYLVVVAVNYPGLGRGFGAGAGETSRTPAEPWWRTAGAAAIGRAMIPLILFNVADWFTNQIAFYRAVSWVVITDDSALKEFQNAFRILQIPQGIFVSALVLVLLPYLSRFSAPEDRDRLGSAAMSGIRLVLYTVAPAVVILGSLTLPIMNILYRHGQFTASEANVAALLSASMAPYVLLSSAGEVLVLTLLVLKKVWTLLFVQLIALAAAAMVSYVLSRQIGLPGIALSVTVVALVNLGLLLWTVERYVQFTEWKESRGFLWKVTAACAAVWLWLALLRHFFPGASLSATRSSLEIVIAAPAAVIIYAAVSAALRIPEWDLVRTALSKYVPGWRDAAVAAGDEAEDGE